MCVGGWEGGGGFYYIYIYILCLLLIQLTRHQVVRQSIPVQIALGQFETSRGTRISVGTQVPQRDQVRLSLGRQGRSDLFHVVDDVLSSFLVTFHIPVIEVEIPQDSEAEIRS